MLETNRKAGWKFVVPVVGLVLLLAVSLGAGAYRRLARNLRSQEGQ